MNNSSFIQLIITLFSETVYIYAWLHRINMVNSVVSNEDEKVQTRRQFGILSRLTEIHTHLQCKRHHIIIIHRC